VKGGRLCHEQYRPPFDGVFNVSEFEYGTRVEVAGIEPASSGISVGLLRAQPVMDCRRRRRYRQQHRPVSDLMSPSVGRSGRRVSPT